MYDLIHKISFSSHHQPAFIWLMILHTIFKALFVAVIEIVNQ